MIRFHGIKSEASPEHAPAPWEALFWEMSLLYAFLALLSLCYGLDPHCPGRCSCDSEQSVQCYRLTEVPSGIPSTTKKLYISHSKIQHLQVITHSPATLFCETGWRGDCGVVKLNVNNRNLKAMIMKLCRCTSYLFALCSEMGICLWIFHFSEGAPPSMMK